MKKKILVLVLCVLLATGFSACSGTPKSTQSQIFAMDTVMNLTVYGKDSEKALQAAADKINALDRELTVEDSGSEVSKLNSASGPFKVSDTVLTQLKTALEVSERSGGAYDITILPLMRLWGFDTDSAHVPPEAEIQAAKAKVDYRKIHVSGTEVSLDGGVQITFASIAKGYTSQVLMNLFRDMGVKSAIVSLGGNVQALGTKPDGSKWKVAIEDPKSPSSYLGTLEIVDRAVITSGGYQRFFEQDGKRYHHILDPKTGYPADNGLTSATIVCEDGTHGDALSTALFTMGKEGALNYWRTYGGFEAVLVDKDGKVTVTEGLKGSFTLSGSGYTLEYAAKSGGVS